MSESVISAAPDWSLERAADEMVQRGIRHLVIVDRGELIGVLSMRDIVRCWTEVGATSSMIAALVEHHPAPSRAFREQAPEEHARG